MNSDLRELSPLDVNLYKCITNNIATDKVVLTDKQLIHIADRHPEAYNDVLIELNTTLESPDYIIADTKHENTGLIIRKITSSTSISQHSFIVLKICTDTHNKTLANSVISGWKISEKRLQSYLRNKPILYKKE